MSYMKWFESHALKHKKIVDNLLELSYTDEEIVDYFDFDNMVKKEIEFCPLYKKNKKCHEMDKLNCYLCACPNFRFNDDGLSEDNKYKTLSRCTINNGEKFATKDGIIHQDCSSCELPHHKTYIMKNFSHNWLEIMKDCKE